MPPVSKILIVALLLAPALAIPALASHGAYVHHDSITSTRTGYVETEAHRFVVNLNEGDRIDVTLETSGATRSVYFVGGGAVPHDLGLDLFLPRNAFIGPICPTQNDPYLSGESTKHRSGVAPVSGEAVIYVKADFVAPVGNVEYRLTVAVNEHQGAGMVHFYGHVGFTDLTPPVCRALA